MGRRKDPVEPFEPMTMGQAMNYGSKIFQRSFIQLMLISIITYVPVALISLMIVREGTPLGLAIQDGQIVASSQGAADRFNQLIVITSLATVIAAIISMASLQHAIGNAYVRREPNWSASIQAALRRIPAILGVVAILTAVVALPIVLMTAVGPGGDGIGIVFLLAIIVMSAMALTLSPVAMAALMREQLGPMAAVIRGWQLLHARWVSTIALFVVSALIVGAAGAVTRNIVEAIVVKDASSVDGLLAGSLFSNMVSSTIWSPLLVCVMTVAYVDMRVRAEGYNANDHDTENGSAGATRTVPPPLDPSTIRLPGPVPSNDLPQSLPATLQPHISDVPLRDLPTRGPRWSQPLPELPAPPHRPHDAQTD